MSIGKSIWQDLQIELRSGNMISRIILINVIVFVLLNLIHLFAWVFTMDKEVAWAIFDTITDWIFQPADIRVFITRPWTIISSMFSQYDFWHLFWNMIMLFWFGRIIKEYIGNQKILPIYIMGGISGGLLYMVSYSIFADLIPNIASIRALGASGAVMAIVMATATLLPDHRIRVLLIGYVKLKYIALTLLALDLLYLTGTNTGGHLAHIGGAAFGYLFIMRLQAGSDWSIPFNKGLDKLESFFMTIINAFRPSKGPRVVYKQEKKASSPSAKSTGSSKSSKSADHQEVVDAILDKINESGYDSLTREEKEILFKAGNRD